jgi:hypothetical protein
MSRESLTVADATMFVEHEVVGLHHCEFDVRYKRGGDDEMHFAHVRVDAYGCSNWTFTSECVHFCDAETTALLGKLAEWIYAKAAKVIPMWDD